MQNGIIEGVNKARGRQSFQILFIGFFRAIMCIQSLVNWNIYIFVIYL